MAKTGVAMAIPVEVAKFLTFTSEKEMFETVEALRAMGACYGETPAKIAAILEAEIKM